MAKYMVIIFAAILILACAMPIMAQFYGQDESVQGHIRHDGTYVQPYHRTAPDRTPFNNYSTQGNINPYTGKLGTVNPYNQPSQQPLGNPYGQKKRQSWP